jgi:hypothetical protein
MRGAFSVLTFEQRRKELEDQGFECVESHLGRHAEIVDSGIVPIEDTNVIIAQFVRPSAN